MPPPTECVKVMIRVRPMNSKEKDRNCLTCLDIDPSLPQITLIKPQDSDAQKVFSYDNVFEAQCSQEKIYENSAFSLVESVAEGYNGTIFAYGQTGCGKTFTMMGIPEDLELKGVIPRTFSHIVKIIESSPDRNFLVRVSYLEIYNEEIRDLLSMNVKAKCKLRESPDKGVFIMDLKQQIVKTVAEMEGFMNVGNNSRTTGETLMNLTSSRSHSIFTVNVEVAQKDNKGNELFLGGKLNLVDLAGSERQSKTGATGDRLKEANKINLSLSALGNVISALVDGKSSHIPYKDSKLTRLLQDSLGGNTKTVMIAAVSPADYNYDETLGTLRYASRAKNIQNKPKVNEDPKDALLKEYAEEIKRLKVMLENGPQNGTYIPINSSKSINNSTQSNNNPNKLTRRTTKEFDLLQDELKKRDADLNAEKDQREKLQQLIKDLDQNRVVGGKGNESEINEYKEMKGKVIQHGKQAEKLIKEKQKAEEDMLLVEKKYQSLQEEVDELRKINKKLKKNYRNAINDLQDVDKEHEINREDLLDSIREQERDLKLFHGMLKLMLKPEEISKVKNASIWDDNLGDFRIPPFTFQEAKVKFPKLAANKVLDMIDNDKNNRDLIFKDTHSNVSTKKNHNNNERNAGSMEPFEKRKSKGVIPDIGPYTHPQSIIERENLHALSKKESGGMPKLKRMPSKQKFDSQSSMEKLTQKFNMYQPQPKDTMHSTIHKLLNEPGFHMNEPKIENNSKISLSPKKNLNGVQLDPMNHKNIDSYTSLDLSDSGNTFPNLKTDPKNPQKAKIHIKGKLDPIRMKAIIEE